MVVGIILTTYKRPQFLPRAIDSVLNQYYRDYICLVVDDGDNDEVWNEVCEMIPNDSRFFAVRSPGNLGAGGSRNLGILLLLEAISEVDALVTLDDDDVYLPHFLSCVTYQISRGVNWGYADLLQEGDDGVFRRPGWVRPFAWDTLVWINPIPHCSVFINVPWLKQHPQAIWYRTSIYSAFDHERWGRMARIEEPIFVSEPMYKWGRSGNNISRAVRGDWWHKFTRRLIKLYHPARGRVFRVVGMVDKELVEFFAANEWKIEYGPISRTSFGSVTSQKVAEEIFDVSEIQSIGEFELFVQDPLRWIEGPLARWLYEKRNKDHPDWVKLGWSYTDVPQIDVEGVKEAMRSEQIIDLKAEVGVDGRE